MKLIGNMMYPKSSSLAMLYSRSPSAIIRERWVCYIQPFVQDYQKQKRGWENLRDMQTRKSISNRQPMREKGRLRKDQQKQYKKKDWTDVFFVVYFSHAFFMFVLTVYFSYLVNTYQSRSCFLRSWYFELRACVC